MENKELEQIITEAFEEARDEMWDTLNEIIATGEVVFDKSGKVIKRVDPVEPIMVSACNTDPGEEPEIIIEDGVVTVIHPTYSVSYDADIEIYVGYLPREGDIEFEEE